MTNNTAISKGITVKLSSNPPTRSYDLTSSGEVRKKSGIYHMWPSAMLAKKAAVQRRRRRGGVTSGAMALALRNSR